MAKRAAAMIIRRSCLYVRVRVSVNDVRYIKKCFLISFFIAHLVILILIINNNVNNDSHYYYVTTMNLLNE